MAEERRRGRRQVQLDATFDRLHAYKLAQVYELLVPVRTRSVDAVSKEDDRRY